MTILEFDNDNGFFRGGYTSACLRIRDITLYVIEIDREMHGENDYISTMGPCCVRFETKQNREYRCGRSFELTFWQIAPIEEDASDSLPLCHLAWDEFGRFVIYHYRPGTWENELHQYLVGRIDAYEDTLMSDEGAIGLCA